MGNFGTANNVQAPQTGKQTNETMKKVLLIVAAVLVSSVVLTSCGSHSSCPAYGKVNKVPTEVRS